MLAARSLRLAAKAPAAPRAAAAPFVARRPVAMSAANRPTADDLEAAKAAAMDYAGKAADAIKNVDVSKLKDQAGAAVQGGVAGVKAALDSALELWGSYDANGDGKLEIKEAVALLNSKEVSELVQNLTGQPHTQRTEADIKKWFTRADWDKSGDLSKREFAILYVGLLSEKAKVGAKGLAEYVCAALDRDGDGQIGSDEFKALLQNTPIAALANAIPSGKNINYREILAKF